MRGTRRGYQGTKAGVCRTGLRLRGPLCCTAQAEHCATTEPSCARRSASCIVSEGLIEYAVRVHAGGVSAECSKNQCKGMAQGTPARESCERRILQVGHW